MTSGEVEPVTKNIYIFRDRFYFPAGSGLLSDSPAFKIAVAKVKIAAAEVEGKQGNNPEEMVSGKGGGPVQILICTGDFDNCPVEYDGGVIQAEGEGEVDGVVCKFVNSRAILGYS